MKNYEEELKACGSAYRFAKLDCEDTINDIENLIESLDRMEAEELKQSARKALEYILHVKQELAK